MAILAGDWHTEMVTAIRNLAFSYRHDAASFRAAVVPFGPIRQDR